MLCSGLPQTSATLTVTKYKHIRNERALRFVVGISSLHIARLPLQVRTGGIPRGKVQASIQLGSRPNPVSALWLRLSGQALLLIWQHTSLAHSYLELEAVGKTG